jgi:hypothetical protein
MASPKALVAAALAGFVIVLVARLPARWAAPLLPPQLACGTLSGTVWNGACEGARVQLPGNPTPRDLGALRWDVDALQLFAARLAAHVDVASPVMSANAQVAVTAAGRLAVRDLGLAATAGPDGLPLLPPDWRGRIRLADATFELDDGRLLELSGTGEVQDLVSLAGEQLGGYRVSFPAQTAAALGPGHIEDTGDGPFDIDAKLVVDPALSWQIDGLVSATPRAGESLQRWIRFLGTPDANGQRPFSLSGSLR